MTSFMFAMAVAATAPTFGQVTKVPEKAARENLKKAQEVLRKTESGLELLGKTAWIASVLAKKPDLAKTAETVAKVKEPINELKKMIDQVNKTTNPDSAKKEAGRFLDKLRLVKLDAQAEELKKLDKAITKIPIGLVADGADDKFNVTTELLIKNPKEAKKRFGNLLTAMKTNADYLTVQHAHLENIHHYCKAASKAMAELNKGIEKALEAGLFTKALIEKYLDVDRLIMAYNEVAADAEKVAKSAKTAAEIQSKRRKNLRDTVNTFFGFKL